MNYDDMPAGREMDALIAATVMGIPKEMWHSECRYHSTDGLEISTYNGDVDDSGWCYTCCKPVMEGEKTPKRYSTDISAAWDVLENLDISLWPEVGRMASWMRGFPNGWYCEICRGGDTPALVGTPVRSVADTAPLAICRAALKSIP